MLPDEQNRNLRGGITEGGGTLYRALPDRPRFLGAGKGSWSDVKGFGRGGGLWDGPAAGA